jgi:hypothetical protein
MEQLSAHNIKLILQEVGAGQCSEWKDTANHSPTYNSYWAQGKSFTLRDGILERHWESAIGWSTINNRPPLEQSEGYTGQTSWGTVMRTPGCQQYPRQGQAEVLLAPGKK